MKKRMFLVLLLLVIASLFYGCASDGTVSDLLQEISASEDSVSTTQIKQDIIAQDEIQTCFSASFTDASPFELERYELIKEQINKEEKEDLVYASVCVKNAYFKVHLNVKCIYNYYEKGGWILDEILIENIEKITPIGAPSKEIVISYISDGNVTDNQLIGEVLCTYNGESKSLKHGILTFLDWEQDGDQAKLYVRYQSDVLTTEGCYVMLFEDNDWHFTNEDKDLRMEVISYTADYSEALGAFTLMGDLHQFDPVKFYGSLNIHEIKNGVANYDLSYWLAKECSIDEGKNLNGSFDELEGTICIGTYLSGDDIFLEYNAEKNQWTEGGYGIFIR